MKTATLAILHALAGSLIAFLIISAFGFRFVYKPTQYAQSTPTQYEQVFISGKSLRVSRSKRSMIDEPESYTEVTAFSPKGEHPATLMVCYGTNDPPDVQAKFLKAKPGSVIHAAERASKLDGIDIVMWVRADSALEGGAGWQSMFGRPTNSYYWRFVGPADTDLRDTNFHNYIRGLYRKGFAIEMTDTNQAGGDLLRYLKGVNLMDTP